jgi:hypothetical protein
MRATNITGRLLAVGVCAAVVLAGCGGGGSSKQATGSQATSPAPSGKQARAAGIPSSREDQKAYFMRIYCIGDSPTQCKCKLESMGAGDSSKFAAVLYGLKRNDQATVIRFGRASTGCA